MICTKCGREADAQHCPQCHQPMMRPCEPLLWSHPPLADEDEYQSYRCIAEVRDANGNVERCGCEKKLKVGGGMTRDQRYGPEPRP